MYLLDSNVFISAHRLHYSFDFHPGFWEWLIYANKAGTVFSIEKVYEEICRRKDRLCTWARDHKDGFFLDAPPDIGIQLEHVTNCVTGEDYKPIAIEEFLWSADYHLIAHALFRNFKIVTHEVPRSRRGKIKIPAVCQKLELECLTPFDMLRQGKAKFVWKPHNG